MKNVTDTSEKKSPVISSMAGKSKVPKSRKEFWKNRILDIYNKRVLTKNDKELGLMYVNLLNEAEGKSPIKKKDLNTKAQIDAYITPLNIEETEASKKRVEQINTEEEAKATGKLRKPKTKEPKTKTKYTVHFRVLTKQESKLQVEGNLFTKGKSKKISKDNHSQWG